MKAGNTAELFLRRGPRPSTVSPASAPVRPAGPAERRPLERTEPLPRLPDDEEVPPFLRPARRVRHRRGRRGLGRNLLVGPLALGLLATGVVWAALTRVMASDRLKVAHVEVQGGRFLSEGEVRNLLGPAVGENILRLDIEALKARLRASPWVADATVVRTLPDTLRVEIRERRPLALAQVDRLYLMDDEGEMVDIYGPSTAGFDLPIVRGLTGLASEARRERGQRAGALLRDLGDLAAEVSEVEPLEGGDFRLVLRGPGEVLLLGEGPWRARLFTFLALRRELDQRVGAAEYFDLRFRDRIFARPRVLPPAEAAPPAPRPAPRPAPAAAVSTPPASPAAPADSPAPEPETPQSHAPELTTPAAAPAPPAAGPGR